MSDPTGPNRDPYPQALWDHPMPNTTSTVNLNDEGLSDGDTIDPYLNSHVSNHTRVEIEPGTYHWNRTRPTGNFAHVHIIGLGDFGDVVWDMGSNNNRGLNLNAANGILLMENITITGTLTDGNNRLRSDARTEDAEVIWKRCRLMDGNASGVYDGAQGWYIGSHNGASPHVGTLRLLWCQANWFVDNGVYADGYAGAQRGQVIVVGGLYQNNNITHVRLGNDYSTAYRVTIDTWAYRGTYTRNQRGFWLRRPDNTESTPENDVWVDNCDIRYGSSVVGTAAVAEDRRLPSDAGGKVRNVRIENNSNNIYAVYRHPDSNSTYQYEDIHITGSGDTRTFNIPSSSVVSNPDSVNINPWWGLEEDPGSPGDPHPSPIDDKLNVDRTSWRRRYVPEVDRFFITPILSPYRVIHGRSDVWNRDTNTTSPDSDSALRFDPPGGGSHAIRSMPGDGLLRYPQRDERFTIRFRQSELNNLVTNRLMFYLEQTNDSVSGYFFDLWNGNISVKEFINGSDGDTLGVADLGYTANEWFMIEVDDDDGVMDFTCYSDMNGENAIGGITIEDDRFNGAGIMFWGPSAHKTGSSHWWDRFDVPDRAHDRLIDNFAYSDLSDKYEQEGAEGFELTDDEGREGNVSLRFAGVEAGESDHLFNGPRTGGHAYKPIRGHYYYEGEGDDMEVEFRFAASKKED